MVKKAKHEENQFILDFLLAKYQKEASRHYGAMSRFAPALKKAAEGLELYPLPIKTGDDAKSINGVGPAIASIVQEAIDAKAALDAEHGANVSNSNAHASVQPMSGANALQTFLSISGLHQYGDKFAAVGYDTAIVLARLTDNDLDAIGVSLVGHRRALVEASRDFAKLNAVVPVALPAPNGGAHASATTLRPAQQGERLLAADCQWLVVPPRMVQVKGSAPTMIGGDRSKVPVVTESVIKRLGETLLANRGFNLLCNGHVSSVGSLSAAGVECLVTAGDRTKVYPVKVHLSSGVIMSVTCDCLDLRRRQQTARLNGVNRDVSICKHGFAVLLFFMYSRLKMITFVTALHSAAPSVARSSAPRSTSSAAPNAGGGAVTTTTTSRTAVSSQPDSALDETDARASSLEPKKKRRKRNVPAKPYEPKYRSGGYGILIALYKAVCDDVAASDGSMKNADLRPLAQPYCEESYERSKNREFPYSAWDSINTLLKHALVERTGRAKHRLTPKGFDMAAELYRKHVFGQSSNSGVPAAGPNDRVASDTPTPATSNGSVADTTCTSTSTLSAPLLPAPPPSPPPISQSRDDVRVPPPLPRYLFTEGSDVDGRDVGHAYRPGDEIVLYVDHREFSNNERLAERLTQHRVAHHSCALALADFLWVLRTRDHGDFALHVCAERKRFDDFMASKIDRRYAEQRFRLQRSGLKHVYYLVEGTLTEDGGSHAHVGAERVTPADLHAEMARTSTFTNFHYVNTRDAIETAAWLSTVTRNLEACWRANRLRGTGMSFDAYQKHNERRNELEIRVVFAQQLMQLRAMKEHVAHAVVQRFGTWRNMYEHVQSVDAAYEADEAARVAASQDADAASQRRTRRPPRPDRCFQNVSVTLNRAATYSNDAVTEWMQSLDEQRRARDEQRTIGLNFSRTIYREMCDGRYVTRATTSSTAAANNSQPDSQASLPASQPPSLSQDYYV